MPSLNDHSHGEHRLHSRRLAHLGLLIGLAGAVAIVETLIPPPMPWLRLGLSNAVVLAALHLGGVRDGAWVGLGKVILGGLATGGLLSPGMTLSFFGTGAAVFVMSCAMNVSPPLGFVGVSVVGAQAHVMAQLVTARYLILDSPGVWGLAPTFSLIALFSGILTGVCGWGVAVAFHDTSPVRVR